ncbi:MAG: hypothetical protein BGO68_04515 [Candidatus Amoebophilus sp. 36-38]|nr:MAG: hypothetical protein BGO68_04515 [Candidatus Amoebophilus sp. 36-38]
MNAVYKRISSIAEVQEFISKQTAQTGELLVIFDMDLTLTMPRLPAFIYLTIPEYRAKLQQILDPLTDSQRRKVLTLALQVAEQQLVEKDSPEIIKRIQAQQIKTIVLTASLTGQLNDEAPMELQRFKKLKDLGIVLEDNCSNKEIALDDLPAYNENCPTYYRGILCANGEPGTNMKGPVLVSFLQHIGFRPKQVIMVDDKKQHLDYVRQSLAALDPTIQFVSLEYVGAYKHIPPYIDEEKFIGYWKDLINQVLHAS